MESVESNSFHLPISEIRVGTIFSSHIYQAILKINFNFTSENQI